MLQRVLVVASAILGMAAPSAAVTVYGLTSSNGLISFDSATPGSVASLGTISQPGIVDLDFSPVNGVLYGITSAGSMYFINTLNASATLAVTPGTALSNVTDLDFNPAADRVRIFGQTDQNYRMVPDNSALTPTGATPGTVIVDGTFTNAAFDLVGSAYTNNFDGVASTVLYSIDTATDSLILHTVAPQFNTVNAVGALGVAVGSGVGFDIGQDGIAYLSDGANFYTVNLATGAATGAGTVGNAGLSSIAVAAVPEPGTATLLGLGLLSLGLVRRTGR